MAYFYPGSSRDRQAREGLLANDRQSQLDGPLPLRSNAGEIAPIGDTTLSTRLPPIGYRRIRDYSWEASGPPTYLNGEVKPMGAQAFDLPPRAKPRSVDYTWTRSFQLPVYQEIPEGQSTLATALPPKGYPRANADDYSYIDPTEIWLIGQDAMIVGEQSTDNLPPRTYPRARDYTWEWNSPPYYMAGEVAPMGVQTYALPPRGPSRCSDFSTPYNLTVWLDLASQAGAPVGQSTFEQDLPPRPYPRARDYSLTDQAQIPQLIGQDAINPGQQSFVLPTPATARERDYTWLQSFELPVFQELPYGQQSYALPPRAYARARDYSFEYQAQLPLLVGSDFMVSGEQLTPPNPKGYARAADYTWTWNDTAIPDFLSSQAPPPGKSTDATALPSRAYARARDYTWVYQAQIPDLVGTDAMVTGEQTYALPTPRAPRAVDYTWLATGVPILDFNVNGNLIPPGQQRFELPPKAQPRAVDYTQIDRLPNLIGQDAVNPGKSTDATALPPKAPARSRDYTWLQTYPLYIYESLPVGQSTLDTTNPTPGQLRLKDYTFLDLTKRHLIGQDFMVPGEQSYPINPIPPYARMRDYTLLQRVNLAELASETRLGAHVLTDRSTFVHSVTDRVTFAHTITDTLTYDQEMSDFPRQG